MRCKFGHVTPQNLGSFDQSGHTTAEGARPRRDLGVLLECLPHGGVRPFLQKSTCLTQLTLGPYEVQIWSRNTPESGVNETLVLHRVEGGVDVMSYEGGYKAAWKREFKPASREASPPNHLEDRVDFI